MPTLHSLLLANTIVMGLLTLIWSKKNLPNFIIKGLFLTLLVLDILALVKL